MTQDRRHDIDALRALAFGVLILYHVGMFYVPWDWHLKSDYSASWLEPVMLFSNQWRMPLIFLISGLAVHFLLPKMTGAGFAWSRIKRLGLPLLFGMAVIVPPQAYLESVSNGGFEGSYGAFLLRYLQLQPWPESEFSGADIGITWNHLWYLPYLLFYTLLLIPAAGLLDRLSQRCARLHGLWLVLVPLLPLMLIGEFVFPRFPYISHSLFYDVYAHAMYGSFFVYGYLIGRSPLLWRTLARGRWVWSGLGVVSFASFLVGIEVLDAAQPAESMAQMFLIYLNRWVWILVVLAWSHQLLNRPMRWLGWANESVYPWYILHQSFTVVIGYHAAKYALGPVIEPLVVLGGTVAGSWALTEAIRRVGWARPLFGLKARRRPQRRTRDALHPGPNEQAIQSGLPD
ncbi:acyltransferase family protein [Abyssibacter sp.]|uniref:acyltransferase family protein n=1 Tax=Abyssibacter sp. TaxID=2320200 RepID=UPI003516B1F1